MGKQTIEQIQKYVQENTNCTLLSQEYVRSDMPLKFKCSCGEEFTTSFNSFKGGKTRTAKQHCDKCGIAKRVEKKSYTMEQIKVFVEENTNQEYKLLEDRFKETNTGRKREIKVKHNKCNKEYWVGLSNWNEGKRCRECTILENAKKARLTTGELRLKVESNEDFEFITPIYKEIEGVLHREKTYLEIKHKKCGSIFVKSLGEWITTPKCSICSSQYRVSYLHIVLSCLFKKFYPNSKNEYDIGFKGEKGGASKYDLFVPNFNGCDTLFEFQSRYHDNKKEFDLKKRKFAIEQGYNFISLDHREVDILDLIKEYFNIDYIPEWVEEELDYYKKR